MPTLLHADQIGLNQAIGANIRLMGQTGLLTDAQVVAATTYTDLQDNIRTNAKTAHSDLQGFVDRFIRVIDLGKADGTLTDAQIQAATGVDNLASLTLADPGKMSPLIE